MKLKKIASLALAGVMAVSMLAGCNFGAADSNVNNSSSNTQVVTSDALEAVKGAIAKVNPDLKVTYKEAANLVSYISNLDDQSYDNLVTKAGLLSAVKKYIDGTSALTTCTAAGSAVKTLLAPTAGEANATAKTNKFGANKQNFVTVVEVEKASGMTALTKAANEFAASMQGVKNEFTYDASDTDFDVSTDITLYAFMVNVEKANTTVPCLVVVGVVKSEF